MIIPLTESRTWEGGAIVTFTTTKKEERLESSCERHRNVARLILSTSIKAQSSSQLMILVSGHSRLPYKHLGISVTISL